MIGPPWAWVLVFYDLLGPGYDGGCLSMAVEATRWWAGLIAWGAIGAAWPMVPTRPDATEAEVFSVGHGLAVVVRSPEGRTVLYDCGKMGNPHVGRRVIAPALWARGVRKIDVLILSHADADHYNGLPDLLDRFRDRRRPRPARLRRPRQPRRQCA